jgi:hypothetical protein
MLLADSETELCVFVPDASSRPHNKSESIESGVIGGTVVGVSGAGVATQAGGVSSRGTDSAGGTQDRRKVVQVICFFLFSGCY